MVPFSIMGQCHAGWMAEGDGKVPLIRSHLLFLSISGSSHHVHDRSTQAEKAGLSAIKVGLFGREMPLSIFHPNHVALADPSRSVADQSDNGSESILRLRSWLLRPR